jgi:hypothetical protein
LRSAVVAEKIPGVMTHLAAVTMVCAVLLRQVLTRRRVRRWARRLRGWWNAGRWRARGPFDAGRYGLVPSGELSARRAGAEPPLYRVKAMQAIADAVWEGDWRAAAAYVEAAGEEWDERWSRLEFLRELLEHGEAWLDLWRAERPDSCDAATLHADRLVHLAWRIRGQGFAHQVPADRMARFREMLPAAIDAAREASRLAPRDPGPWVVMLTAARGARYSHGQFGQLWQELLARAPYHYEAHCQALQFWCAKWAGSDEAMFRFSREAVDRAPAGSPLAGVHLLALCEYEHRHGGAAAPRSAEDKALLAKVARSLGEVPETDERLAPLRHLLAYQLGRAGLYALALEQFRLIGRWCGAYPWTRNGAPVADFDVARRIAARRGGTRTTVKAGTPSTPSTPSTP